MKKIDLSPLFSRSIKLMNLADTSFKRKVFDDIFWTDRLIGLLGARGTGKTTLLLQRMKALALPEDQASYWSLDDIFFANHSLIDCIHHFYNYGGRQLFIDEVHKYPNWSAEIKNIYDTYLDLNIVFTGSSLIDISKQHGDLSRRAVIHKVPGLSFREYLGIQGYQVDSPIQMNDLVKNHIDIAHEYTKGFNPLVELQEYLQHGYYPFFTEGIHSFSHKLNQVVRLVVENELQFLEEMDFRKSRKILQLLGLIAENVPFTPNISSLATKLEIHRNTLVTYLHYLSKADLIRFVNHPNKVLGNLQKPDKIYLQNTCLAFQISTQNPQIGTLRETFFASQLGHKHEIALPKKGDFLIDNQYTFEVGGKSKSIHQLIGVKNAFVVADDILHGTPNQIPLWLFGFLY